MTFFNYVGKPLTYILATPEQPDDADNPLNFAFGNEAAPLDIDRFAQRFGCIVVDGYGSTEGGANMSKSIDTPPGALGKPVAENVDVSILDPETSQECPRAEFDADGRFVNAEAAIGEMVNVKGSGGFEGYYNNEEANAERMRGGMYWTGDLGYRDENGFFYFAGRNSDWLRVDGENFAAAPVENVLARHPSVVLCAVYAVPAVDVGDDVMAAIHLHEGHDVRRDGVRRVPGRAGRSLTEVGAALRPDQPRAAVDGDAEGAQAGAATRALGDRRRGLVATGTRSRVPPVHPRRRFGAARAVRGAEPRPPARTSVRAARAACLCSLRHGDGTLPNGFEGGFHAGELTRGNESARDAPAVEGIDDRTAVERAFGVVQERVRGDDLLERTGQVERPTHDRGTGDAHAALRELVEHLADCPRRLIGNDARRLRHELRRRFRAHGLRGVVDEAFLRLGHEHELPLPVEHGARAHGDGDRMSRLGEATDDTRVVRHAVRMARVPDSSRQGLGRCRR